MNSSSIIGLINNAALLLALGLLYDMLGFRPRGGKPSSKQFLTGVILGAVGIAMMLNPWEFGNGVVFDTRSVLLCISGFFFGTIPVLLAVVMTAAFRVYMGGAGAWTGVAVIVTSGGIGLAWRHLRSGNTYPSIGELYLLGILVHAVMLLWMLTLPWPVATGVLSKTGLPIILIYPLTTAILGTLLVNRSRRRESETKFRNIFDSSSDAIFIHDMEGNFLEVNEIACKRLGYTREELLRMRLMDIDTPEFARLGPERIESIAETHQAVFEAAHRRKDGVEFPVEISSRRIEYDGNPCILSVARDISERRRAEQALRTSHQRFLTVLDSIDATIYVADMETYEVLFMNRHMIESFGRDMTGNTCWKVFRGESGPCPHCTNGALLDDKGKPAGVHVWQGRNPVTGRWYINYDRAIEWIDGRLVRIQIATDITDVKALEEQLRQAHKMEAIGTLAGGIAHDFNNILSVIVGNTELAMLDLPEWSPAQDSLKEVREATLRARELVKQILLFARQKEQTLSHIHMEPIVRESLKMLRASIPATVEIREALEEGLPSVLADPSQIQQVIMNLCTNAGQVMEAEGGTLTFALDSADLEAPLHTVADVLPSGRYVRMQVRDTGPGIPADIQARIFDPFFTTKGVGEGTGLGLAVVHGIVQDRKGGITVESEEGRGTTFIIYLPASDLEPVEGMAEQPRNLPRGTERILFADDEAMIRNMAQRMLERQGYRVETRAGGTEALESFTQDPDRFDLVVTDMTMPGMTGDRLAEAVLAIRPDIPVILCTGYSRQISEEKAQDMGIRALVMKPLTRHELADTVRRVLDETQPLALARGPKDSI